MKKTVKTNRSTGHVCNISFIREAQTEAIRAVDLCLFFVMRGDSGIAVDDGVQGEVGYQLEMEDLLVVNEGESYRITETRGLMARIDFSHELLYELLGGRRRCVNCCSVNVRNGSFDGLKSQIRKLLGTLFGRELAQVAFERSGYEVLMTLLGRYSEERPEPGRREQVDLWLGNRFREPVTLDEAADQFGLTPQYFSKWFTESHGVSFLKYLASLRCESAREDLIHTEGTILKIALDNGFPNGASFTRAFTERYGQSPLKYRKLFAEKKGTSLLTREELIRLVGETEAEEDTENNITLDNSTQSPWLEPYWNAVCNLGEISRLGTYESQSYIKELVSTVKYRYGRILLDTWEKENADVYLEYDRAIAFIYDIRITPIFVIDYRHCLCQEGFYRWLKDFFTYIAHRFGFQEVNVEIFYDTIFTQKKAAAYREFLLQIRKCIRDTRMEEKIMGPGLLLNADGSNLEYFLKENPEIDTVSIRTAPYEIQNDKGVNVRVSQDEDYLLHQFRLAREIVEKSGREAEVLVTSWQNSFMDRDVLNDSSWMAASIIRSALKGYGTLTSLPIAKPLDIMQERSRSSEGFFCGRPGLITVNALKKPSYFALSFLSHLDERVLYCDEHMIVSASNDNYFQIVIQNCCPLSYRYYMGETPKKASDKGYADLFETRVPYNVNLEIRGVPDMTWFVKVRRVNEEKGNACHTWDRMHYDDISFIGRDEIEFLKNSGLPDMTGFEINGRENVLRLQASLEPNEIRHIHIIPKR
ncbi:MAG: helix-turn-helix domain-containing protein [Eubacterium sp.]|nr:helix-turn-helix domain-containing protein [Eubacterium sp.]